MKTPPWICLCGTLFLALSPFSVCGQGTILASHSGSADPTTEGFTLLRSGNPSLSPVTGDLGEDAWSITLNSAADVATYSQRLTAEEQASLESGWTISLSLRIVEPFRTPINGTAAGIYTGDKYFLLFLGAESDGDPVIMMQNFLSYTLVGGGSGYHDYQLSYEPGKGSASLWIDGTERLTGISGGPSSQLPKFEWGGFQNAGHRPVAHWNEASLWVIPEPSTMALLGWGAMLLVGCLLRHRPNR